MSVNPNSPLWSIYLWLLIHGGDPAPDEIFKNVFTAGILVQVASTVREPQVREVLQQEALRQFQSSFKNQQFEK